MGKRNKREAKGGGGGEEREGTEFESESESQSAALRKLHGGWFQIPMQHEGNLKFAALPSCRSYSIFNRFNISYRLGARVDAGFELTSTRYFLCCLQRKLGNGLYHNVEYFLKSCRAFVDFQVSYLMKRARLYSIISVIRCSDYR
jgi:hypothetical protein